MHWFVNSSAYHYLRQINAFLSEQWSRKQVRFSENYHKKALRKMSRVRTNELWLNRRISARCTSLNRSHRLLRKQSTARTMQGQKSNVWESVTYETRLPTDFGAHGRVGRNRGRVVGAGGHSQIIFWIDLQCSTKSFGKSFSRHIFSDARNTVLKFSSIIWTHEAQ